MMRQVAHAGGLPPGVRSSVPAEEGRHLAAAQLPGGQGVGIPARQQAVATHVAGAASSSWDHTGQLAGVPGGSGGHVAADNGALSGAANGAPGGSGAAPQPPVPLPQGGLLHRPACLSTPPSAVLLMLIAASSQPAEDLRGGSPFFKLHWPSCLPLKATCTPLTCASQTRPHGCYLPQRSWLGTWARMCHQSGWSVLCARCGSSGPASTLTWRCGWTRRRSGWRPTARCRWGKGQAGLYVSVLSLLPLLPLLLQML